MADHGEQACTKLGRAAPAVNRQVTARCPFVSSVVVQTMPRLGRARFGPWFLPEHPSKEGPGLVDGVTLQCARGDPRRIGTGEDRPEPAPPVCQCKPQYRRVSRVERAYSRHHGGRGKGHRGPNANKRLIYWLPPLPPTPLKFRPFPSISLHFH